MIKPISFFAAVLGVLAASATGASATPQDGAIGMQPAASALAEQVQWFHNGLLMPIITAICLLVLALLLWIVFRYNARSNPTPGRFSHNMLIEVIWTVIPVLILVVIAVPSFELLYAEDVVPDGKSARIEANGAVNAISLANDFSERRKITKPRHVSVYLESGGARRELAHGRDFTLSGLGDSVVTATLKTLPPAGSTLIIEGGRSRDLRGAVTPAPSVTVNARGYQWYWSYAYPEFGVDEFVSAMAPASATTPDLYKLEVDRRMVVPVGETIRIITRAADVIHAWAVPAFAIKIDAVPGRNNETWFRADREGVYYGQCSEICGVDHSFMPIAVEVVSREKFENWIDERRKEVGIDPLFAAAPALAIVEPSAEAPVVAQAELEATINRCQQALDALTASQTINFASGGAAIDPASRAFLDEIAVVARGCDGPVITVSGHTDATGSEPNNVTLSTGRAEAVRDYLVSAGFPADRMAAVGYGSSQPIADNATDEGRARNRRIVFTVSAPTPPASDPAAPSDPV